jgi:secreted PhoX family phosphatase
MEDLPTPQLRYFGALLDERLSRRQFLATSGVAAAVAGALPVPGFAAVPDAQHGAGKHPPYKSVGPSRADAVLLSPGLRHEVLIGWGDPLFTGDPGLSAKDIRKLDWLDDQAAARQERRFGTNNDALAFFQAPGRRSAGVLCVNHEYVMPQLSLAGLPESDSERAKGRDAWIKSHPQSVPWMQAAHGVSVLDLQRGARGWRVLRGGPSTRRITANTPMQISGPARGDMLLRTNADPSGTVALGTFANCAGGKTPWGTYLTAEENIQDYFGGARSLAESSSDDSTKAAHRRWPLRERSAYGWEVIDPRFDLRREPREPLRHGWIVEIDPQDPTSPPKKRTALGRFCHEGANTIVAKDGRVAAYMGDDAKFEYVYKFVTRDRFDPRSRAANRDLLDHGVLHAARFDADGRGEWLPLVHDENGPLSSRNGFRNQAEVVIKCRAAADLLGATPMDRPEDVEPSPVTGRVYMALTKNDERAPNRREFNGREIDLGPNASNPRPKNDFGHIIELIEDNDDAAGTRFSWNVFLLAGDPRNPAARFLTRAEDIAAAQLAREDVYYGGFADRALVSPIACPDNLGFDPSGRLWVVTDADESLIGNNGCFVVPTSGSERGLLRQVMSAPVGAEVCGCEFTPDGTTLFLSVQHPGEGGTVDAPVSHWPDGNGLPARSAVIAVSREDGAPL